ncbi:MAG: hypothetical protein KA712_18885 [Myxococcales bacterium]|nr:hypothetical protein [Myxococcales bacterium]
MRPTSAPSPSPRRPFVSPLAVSALCLAAFSGCPLLAHLPVQAPSLVELLKPVVSFQDAVLVRAPSRQQLAAHYCPRVVDPPFGLRSGLEALCEGFFGPPPSAEDMKVGFDLQFHIDNPNQFPLPMGSALTAIDTFANRAGGAVSLGAVCVQFCPEGVTCSGQAAEGACRASERDVRSLSDFGQAATNLIIGLGAGLARGEKPAFTLPPIASGGSADVFVRYAFGPEKLWPLMQNLAADAKEELAKGRMPEFRIPYKLEGTLFFDAGSIGRAAVGFGPRDGTWPLPTEPLRDAALGAAARL